MKPASYSELYALLQWLVVLLTLAYISFPVSTFVDITYIFSFFHDVIQIASFDFLDKSPLHL